ncbi:zinc transporter ZIP11-like [Oscarella lobularis]|uniref:zinc transporter ZIP11-like n=1 Tax=Oscarella lobularis TaxID=121494 RepID=UPI003313B579
MIEGYSAVIQALFGTLFTWAVTAAGAAVVFIATGDQRKTLDGSLGFAAGVMMAASYWSLLAPALEMAEQSGTYGEDGWLAFLPVSIGFVAGAGFVYSSDWLLPYLGLSSGNINVELTKIGDDNLTSSNLSSSYTPETSLARRRLPRSQKTDAMEIQVGYADDDSSSSQLTSSHAALSWKRIALLVIAVTVHNVPEGLAVGVGFGAVGKSASATFSKARHLAIGIGIQNFPEGLAVSLPLKGLGYSSMRSFWYGQLSGMVEPIAGVLGAIAVQVAEPLLPYALAFAAGAMIYVVVDDIIPEAQCSGNGRLASIGSVCGFIVMMSLDVGLG